MTEDRENKKPERLAIIIPAKNEEASVGKVISEIKSQSESFDIIVVNDASLDNTLEVIQEHDVTVINHSESLGAWRATQTGLLWCLSRDYQYVVSMDADGQHLPSEISKLVAEVDAQSKPDLIVGSCPLRADRLKQMVWSLLRTISGIKIRDITSGFRLYNRRAMTVLASQRASLIEYQDIGVLISLTIEGLNIAEVPVEMEKRFEGKSRIFSSWGKIFYYLFSTLLISLSKIVTKKTDKIQRKL